MKSPLRLIIALAILLATATVAAQVYKWVDKDGKVQYSDTPPPPSATKAEAKKVDAVPSAPATTAASAPAAGKALQDRNKDYDKRRADAAEKSKKDDEAQKTAAAEDENCRRASAAVRDLESGRPITKVGDSGEILFVTDEQRQAEIAKARDLAASYCKVR